MNKPLTECVAPRPAAPSLLPCASPPPPCSQPSGDAELVASMEQALPLQRDWLNFNRFALRAEKTVPLGPLRWRLVPGLR